MAKLGRPTTEEKHNPTHLTKEQIDMALNHVLDLQPLDLLCRKLGFKNKLGFLRYLKANPDFDQDLTDAKIGACKFLEDELFFASDSDSDPRAAKIKMDSIVKLLGFLDPKKYGPKLDVNMNQMISIRANLEIANERVAQIMKDVTPVMLMNTNKL